MPYSLYEVLFGTLLARRRSVAPRQNFRFKHPLCSLDISTIDLCLSIFRWAFFLVTKGAIKLHVGVNYKGYLSVFVTIIEGKKHDVTVGRLLKFTKGSTVTIDKDYNDYAWYNALTNTRIFFVTRLKSNAKHRVIFRRSVLKEKGLTCDQTIEFSGSQTAKKCSIHL